MLYPTAEDLHAHRGEFQYGRHGTPTTKALQQARTAKQLTQADLARLISERVQVVNEYESGKAIPNGAIIQKLNRILGVTLPKASA